MAFAEFLGDCEIHSDTWAGERAQQQCLLCTLELLSLDSSIHIKTQNSNNTNRGKGRQVVPWSLLPRQPNQIVGLWAQLRDLSQKIRWEVLEKDC